MRILESLIYPFKQPHWPQKLLLAILFAAIPFFGFFIIKGWEFEISVKVRRNESDLLPYWDSILRKLWRGIRLRLTGFLFFVPAWFFAILGIVLWARQVGGYLADPTVVKSWAGFADLMRHNAGLYLVLGISALLSVVVGNILYGSGYLRYIETRDYTAFFDLWKNLSLAVKNIWDDILVGVFLTVLGIVVGAIDTALVGLLSATGVGALLAPMLVPSFTFSVLSLVSGYLYGQLAERTLGPSTQPSPFPQRKQTAP